jgi:hypothetical protein
MLKRNIDFDTRYIFTKWIKDLKFIQSIAVTNVEKLTKSVFERLTRNIHSLKDKAWKQWKTSLLLKILENKSDDKKKMCVKRI